MVCYLRLVHFVPANVVTSATSTDILPIVVIAMESPAPSLVDASLRSLPIIVGVLDFPTIKNELFPVIATVFSKTSSLGIKVRGLEAFIVLCGGNPDPDGSVEGGPDEMTGSTSKKTTPNTVLDKYTVQEKIVPLLKGIKTKEPAVMVFPPLHWRKPLNARS
jgi:SCY1-like protein 2